MRNELQHSRAAEPHEELLSIFLNRPKRFKEYRHTLEPDIFQSYANVYKLMTLIDSEVDGWKYTDLYRMSTDADRNTLEELRGVFMSEHVLDYLLIQSKKNLLDQRLREIAKGMGEEGDADEKLRHVQDELYKLYTTETDKVISPEKKVDEWWEWIEEIYADPSKAYGMMLGIDELDRVTKGFKKGDFIVIGAATSMGKSAFTIELALRLTQRGYKGAIFSLEMSTRQIYSRMAANLSQVVLDVFGTGKFTEYDLQKIKQNKEIIKKVYIDDQRGISADYIADQIGRLKREQGLDFVMVDYIQDVKEHGETNDNQGSAISRVCRKLRAAAQKHDCAIFGLSQVTREVAKRTGDKRPTVADLAGSTGIETSADMIMLLYRDDYYYPDSKTPNIMEVDIAKHRNGGLGKADLNYDRKKQIISSSRG